MLWCCVLLRQCLTQLTADWDACACLPCRSLTDLDIPHAVKEVSTPAA